LKLKSCSTTVFAAFLFAGGIFTTAHGQFTPAVESNFGLHDGDRVAFYGDSITEQRQYTVDVEEYVLTRFPGWRVSFHNAGVSGDKVSGGSSGPVDLRLRRDVFDVHPDVVTVMLGMNDMYYRGDDPGIFSTYADGYRHIVESLQKNLGKARITLIEPSPYDDVTREPLAGGGLNSVLQRYSSFVADLSRERHTQLADLNTPVTAFLKTLNQQNPVLATQLIPDRVHPQQAGHWLMAESLLKTWNAPSLVTSVSFDAASKAGAEAQNTLVTDLRRTKTGLSWTQVDRALPLPLPPAEVDPVLAVTAKLSDLVPSLDQETLRLFGLAVGNYDLSIDDRKIATFSSDDLTSGVNLALLNTPMLEQSRLVAYDTEKKNSIEAARFQLIRVSREGEASPTAQALAAALTTAEARQRADAQPRPHRYQLLLQSAPQHP
jgi:lysophospholipase L1-like esterase